MLEYSGRSSFMLLKQQTLGIVKVPLGIPWVPEVFFLVGDDRTLSGEAAKEPESRSGEKKTSGTNR